MLVFSVFLNCCRPQCDATSGAEALLSRHQNLKRDPTFAPVSAGCCPAWFVTLDRFVHYAMVLEVQKQTPGIVAAMMVSE